MINIILQLNLIVHYALLGATLFSIISTKNRIWPAQKRNSWQFYGYWILFYIAIGLTLYTSYLTWNSWGIPTEIRIFIGIPLALLGGAFSIWGVVSLGLVNTHGLKNGFIEHGAYKFTRNPQYVGDIFLIVGLMLIANSLYVFIPLLLQIIMFIIMPLSEEPVLEDQYSNMYTDYKNKTSRFL